MSYDLCEAHNVEGGGTTSTPFHFQILDSDIMIENGDLIVNVM